MKIRTMQIWGFLLATKGWIFVACSMAMEGWKITSVGGQGGSAIMTVGWYWSSLWRACYTDSSATNNCYDFPVLWSVEGYIQIVRALLMSGMSVGVLSLILSLVGMECTYIGGKDKEKIRSVCTGGIGYIISGLLAASGYAVYAQSVSAEYFMPKFKGLQFDLGTPLFLGWVGCAFQITGGLFFIVSVCKIRSQTASALNIPIVESNALRSSRTNISIISELSTKSNTSAISELSSKSKTSGISNAPSKKTHVSRTQRPSRSWQSEKSRHSVGSEGLQSVSSSRSVRTSKPHQHNKKVSATQNFIKNSYL